MTPLRHGWRAREGPTISVIIATANRPELRRAIRSSRWADEIVVVFDAAEPPWRPRGCTVLAIGPTHEWGHVQRNRGLEVAAGTHLAFMDDDDAYTSCAGRAIRVAVESDPNCVHVFSMRNKASILSGPVEIGRISTQMFVVPREPVGTWTARYQGDFDFISETLRLRGDAPVFHPEVIAEYRPSGHRTFRSRLGGLKRRLLRSVRRPTGGPTIGP